MCCFSSAWWPWWASICLRPVRNIDLESIGTTISDIKKAVLSYSGGLDTSVILKWLQDARARSSPSPPISANVKNSNPRATRRCSSGIEPEQIYIEDLPRRFVRLPDVPLQHHLRGRIPARHFDRTPADCQAPDRDRATPGVQARFWAPPARATTRCGSNSALRARTRRQGHVGASGVICCRVKNCMAYAKARAHIVQHETQAGGSPSAWMPTCCTITLDHRARESGHRSKRACGSGRSRRKRARMSMPRHRIQGRRRRRPQWHAAHARQAGSTNSAASTASAASIHRGTMSA